MVLVTVRGLGGDVLLGPVEVDSAETVEGLTRRLTGSTGSTDPWRLLQGDDCLRPSSKLAELGTSLSLTAVVSRTLTTELAELCAATQRRGEERQRRNAAWLEELPEATAPRKRQRREEDIQEYERALAILVENMSSIALARSKVYASEGKSSSQYDFQQEAVLFDLTAKMFQGTRDLRRDPVLRGWYFTENPEHLDTPQDVKMDNQRFYRWCMKVLRPRVMDHLRQMDLTVKEHVLMCHVITIHWEDPAA